MSATAKAIPTTGQLIRWGFSHLELIQDAGDLAFQLADADTDTMVERWDAIKPFGDKLAPAVDELLAGGITISGTESEGELKCQLLAKLDAMPRATATASARDGRWLEAALKLITLLLPIFIK